MVGDLVMRNKIYSERRRKIHSLYNQVVKNSFVTKLIRNNQVNNDLEIDPLTGIYNQFAINNYLQELHPQLETSFGIILLSISNFKQIKQEYSPDVANKALGHIAQLLSSNIRETDLIGRYSESEFILILGDVNQEQALGVADRLIRLIQKNHFRAQYQLVPVTASCGVSVSKHDTMSTDVLQQADQALYQSKHNGFNNSTLFNASF